MEAGVQATGTHLCAAGTVRLSSRITRTQLPTRLTFIRQLEQATVDATVLSQHTSDNAHSMQPAATQKHFSLALTCLHIHRVQPVCRFTCCLLCGFSVCSRALPQSAFCTLRKKINTGILNGSQKYVYLENGKC